MRADDVRTILAQHRPELDALGVRRLYVFGSVGRGDAGPNSDVDFLVEFEAYTFRAFMGLKLALEAWLARPVDLATEGSLKMALQDEVRKGLRRVA